MMLQKSWPKIMSKIENYEYLTSVRCCYCSLVVCKVSSASREFLLAYVKPHRWTRRVLKVLLKYICSNYNSLSLFRSPCMSWNSCGPRVRETYRSTRERSTKVLRKNCRTTSTAV